MHIDWVTVAAQIINFLVLVWLLKRFLYGPITAAMQRREAGIKARLNEAAGMKAAADARAADLTARRQELEDGRQSLLAAARTEADALRHQLTAEVRAEVEAKRKAWRGELDEDRAEFLASISSQAATGFRQLAGDALAQLADADLADRFAAALARRLDTLAKADVERLRKALAEAGGRLMVEAPAELSPAARRQLTAAIKKTLGAGLHIGYAQPQPDLTGIRLRAHGETVEWTLAEYVERYAKRLAEIFPAGVGASLG